jgi:hypothetical protein
MLCALRVGELFIVLCRSLARTVRIGVGFVRVEFFLCRVTGLRPRHDCDWMWVGMGKEAAGGVV